MRRHTLLWGLALVIALYLPGLALLYPPLGALVLALAEAGVAGWLAWRATQARRRVWTARLRVLLQTR
jgi:hypothetical protein